MIRIANGTIVDGTGKPAFVGDVLIEGDRIVDVIKNDELRITNEGRLDSSKKMETNSAIHHSSFLIHNSTIDEVADSTIHNSSFVIHHSTIDATGLIVTPGFIDAHAHSDAYLVLEPGAPSKISQGITTEINGQCGGSVAPRYGEARLSSDWASLLGDRLTWRSLAEYREVLSAAKPAINTVQFVGHNTLRSSVVGYAGRAATPDEMKRMKFLLEQALDEGGWGLTTGLIYQPGKYSTPEEVVALAKVAAAKGGYYATHMRSEGDRILEAIDEVIDLVKATGIRAEISHLKTSGQKNWHKIDAVLDKIQDAVDDGLLLGSDRYPYCAAGTDLDVVLPDWAQVGGAPAEMARLRDEGLRLKIIDEINASDRDWSTVMVGGTWAEETKRFSGKTVAEIMRNYELRITNEGRINFLKEKKSSTVQPSTSNLQPESNSSVNLQPDDNSAIRNSSFVIHNSNSAIHHSSFLIHNSPGSIVCSILGADQCRTGAFFFGMSEDNLAKIYARPWIVPGSDASLRAPWGPLGNDHPHPRAYGTMPEFYAKVRALGFSREETVARMTSVPAKRFGIKNRGVIEKGAFADIVVWDEAKFRATATYDKPHQFSDGVKLVLVNGRREGGGRFLERA